MTMLNKTTNIGLVLIIIIGLTIVTNCVQPTPKGENKLVVKNKEDSLNVKIGDDIKSLISSGYVLYNTIGDTKYTLANKSFGGVEFQQADVNTYYRNNDKIVNISYASLLPKNVLNEKYTTVLKYMESLYGEPMKEYRTRSTDNVAIFTGAIWRFKKTAISLSTTVPRNEERGTVIIIFSNPKYLDKFDVFFKQ